MISIKVIFQFYKKELEGAVNLNDALLNVNREILQEKKYELEKLSKDENAKQIGML